MTKIYKRRTCEPVDPTQKYCRTCGQCKDRTLFHNWTIRKDGKQTRCKACMLKYCNENPERINENSRAYRARDPEKARAYGREYGRRAREEKATQVEAADISNMTDLELCNSILAAIDRDEADIEIISSMQQFILTILRALNNRSLPYFCSYYVIGFESALIGFCLRASPFPARMAADPLGPWLFCFRSINCLTISY
jgi:hypothetical protein